MLFFIPTDGRQLMQQVLSYMHHMQAFLPDGLAEHLNARYFPGDFAAEASVAVRLLAIEPLRLKEFETVMDATGADTRRHDDERSIRLDNWPARWASMQSDMPLIFIAGPNKDGAIYAEFFAECGDVPANIYQDYPDGRLFKRENGVPT